MNRIILVLVFLVSAVSSPAQTRWSLGIDYVALRTNISVPNDAARAMLAPLNSHGGALSLQWRVNERATIESGAILGAVGSRWTETSTQARLESGNSMLAVPLLAHITMVARGPLSLDATAGLAITRAGNGKLSNRDNDQVLGTFTTNHLGTAAILGTQISFAHRFPIRAAIRYHYGLGSTTQGEDGFIRGLNFLLGAKVMQW